MNAEKKEAPLVVKTKNVIPTANIEVLGRKFVLDNRTLRLLLEATETTKTDSSTTEELHRNLLEANSNLEKLEKSYELLSRNFDSSTAKVSSLGEEREELLKSVRSLREFNTTLKEDCISLSEELKNRISTEKKVMLATAILSGIATGIGFFAGYYMF